MTGRSPITAVSVIILALAVALIVSPRSGRRSDRELSGTIETCEVQVASKVTAPIAGAVATVAFRVGETVMPGSTPVAIVNLDQTWLNVYVPERLLGRVKLGDTCRVRIDGHPKKEFLGTLSFIAEKAEFTPKDIQTKEERINQIYRVKIALPNPEHRLKPGMPADAYLSLH